MCGPGQTAALDNFRTSLAQLRLALEGGLPDLEMTPLTILDVIGVEPPSFPTLPYLPEGMATLTAAEVAILLKDAIEKEFGTVPELEPENLRWRVEALREATDPAAHEMFDMCLTRFAVGDTFRDEILAQLAFDTIFTFRFPEEYRERMTFLFNALLLTDDVQVAGLTKMRRLKRFWDKSLERILKKHPMVRGEILAVDQEMRPRTYKDFLGWEVIHHSVLGFARKRMHPVTGFSLESEDRLRARCKAHKTALRAFLDEIPRDELAGELRPRMAAWTPGWLVPCRADGTFETPVSTGEVPVWAGPSPPAPLPPASPQDSSRNFVPECKNRDPFSD